MLSHGNNYIVRSYRFLIVGSRGVITLQGELQGELYTLQASNNWHLSGFPYVRISHRVQWYKEHWIRDPVTSILSDSMGKLPLVPACTAKSSGVNHSSLLFFFASWGLDFCCRLQQATILTVFIAALTLLCELPFRPIPTLWQIRHRIWKQWTFHE